MRSKYIGKTARIAAVLSATLPTLQRGDGEPITRCLLFTGPPGTGKTSLAAELAAAVSGDSAFAVEYCNGQSCTIEQVRRWRDAQCYRPLNGTGTGVYLVDEIDGASLAACNELRTFLDRMYPGRIFIATTNKKPCELQEQLHSRFKLYRFEPVPECDIVSWLESEFPTITHDAALEIAKGVNGNVRAARADALTLIEEMAVS